MMLKIVSNNISWLILLLGLPQIGLGQQKLLDAKITFTIENAGISVDGSLKDASGTIQFNPANLSASAMDVSVPVSTLKTGNSMRDGHLKKKEYFDAAAYPSIQMKSKFFGKQEAVFRGYFTLTMKGVSKDVLVLFTQTQKNNRIFLEGNFELNRRDFGVGSKSMLLSDLVKVNVLLELLP